MITGDDMPKTIELNPREKDPIDWLQRMMNVAEAGTRIVYGRGVVDAKIMKLMRDSGGIVIDESKLKVNKINHRVRLFQRRENGIFVYIAEVC